MAYLTVTAGDEASLRAQTAAAAAGDYVLVPPGTYALTATITVTTGCKIIGSGATSATAGPTIITVNGAVVANAITIDASAAADYAGTALQGFEVYDVRFVGAAGAVNGILNDSSGGTTHHFDRTIIQDCTFSGFVNGIKLAQANLSGGAATHLTIRDCEFTSNSGRNIWLINATMARIERCEINGAGLQGVLLQTCPNAYICANAIEGNNTTNAVDAAQISLQVSHNCTIIGTDIENMPTNAAAMKTGVEISNCVGSLIQTLSVSQSAFQSNSIAIRYANPLCKGHVIDSLIYQFITTPVSVGSGCETPFMRQAGIIQFAP